MLLQKKTATGAATAVESGGWKVVLLLQARTYLLCILRKQVIGKDDRSSSMAVALLGGCNIQEKEGYSVKPIIDVSPAPMLSGWALYFISCACMGWAARARHGQVDDDAAMPNHNSPNVLQTAPAVTPAQ